MLEWELSQGSGRGIAQFNLLVDRDRARALQRGRAPDRPLKAIRVKKGKVADVIGLSRVFPWAVSHRFVAATEGLTGLSFTPVDLVDGPAQFAVLGVTGACGSTLYSRARVVQSGERIVRLHGLVVEDPTPGTDVAMPSDRLSVLLSSRAAEQLASANLTNLSLKRMTDIEYDVTVDHLGPIT